MPNAAMRALSRAPLSLSLAGTLLLPGGALAQSPAPSATTEAGTPVCSPGKVGRIDHPTDCLAIVLRMDTYGAFTSLETALTLVPPFTLYGDGSVIFVPQPAGGMYPGPGEPFAPLVRAVMTPEQVDALLTFALGEGGLADAGELYTAPVMDAGNTDFIIDAAGISKRVTVQALGFDDPSIPDAAARARFARLGDLLDSFEEQVAQGNVESAAPYGPARYRGMLTEVWEGAGEPVVEWPWTDLALDDFVTPQDGPAAYAGLTPEQVALVTPVPSGGITNIRLQAPDGSQRYLAIRPLLPDEDVLPGGVAVP